MPDFVLNDQTQENAHGFYLRNEGGRFDRFRANPVLLHNHDENKLFGKWENLRIEGDKLVATPVFDQDDAEALKIQKKVDKGFLKGGSPGIIILNAELLTENGKDKVVVTEWELMEGSVVPVPSNRGSVCLYAPDGTRLKDDQVKLSLNELINKSPNLNTNMDTKTLAVLLSLNPSANEDQITEAIKGIVAKNQQHVSDLSSKDAEILKLKGLIDAEKQAKVKNLIDQAITDKKIDETLRATYTKLAETDYDGCVKALGAMTGVAPIVTNLGSPVPGDVPEAEKSWTFKDYLKNNKAEQLKATNIERFKMLYKAEYKRDYAG